MPLPTVLVSSVTRVSKRGETHGRLELVDLESGNVGRNFQWDDENIDWSGRGNGRGLMRIAFHDGQIYVASSEAFLVLDRELRLVRAFSCPYLKGRHGITYDGRRIFVTSVRFDSLLTFDLEQQRFVHGLAIRVK